MWERKPLTYTGDVLMTLCDVSHLSFCTERQQQEEDPKINKDEDGEDLAQFLGKYQEAHV